MKIWPSEDWRHANRDTWLTIKFAVIGGVVAVLIGLAVVAGVTSIQGTAL